MVEFRNAAPTLRLAITFLAIMLSNIATGQTTETATQLPVQGRSVIETKFGIVATSQPLASMAGVQILERGGNAIDAAIAANATLGLMEPTSNGIGGDLFAIIYDAKSKKLYGLNSSGWSPKGLTPELLTSKRITTMPERGVYTITVPGAVAGWSAMRQRFGTQPFSTLLAPAIYYAEHGFPVNQVTAGLWSRSVKMLRSHPNSASTFLLNGEAPKAGQVFSNRDLAASLRRITQQGRDGFYKGENAQAIVDASRELGGVLTLEDLGEFQPEWVTPISTTYRGWTVYEIPPNTQGIAALIMLNLMETVPLGEYGFHSARALHTMIEAKKLAYADMLRYVGDPNFSNIPVEQLLNKNHASERAKLIGESANCKPEPSQLAGVTSSKGNDTIYMSVIDKDGNIVSLIQSNYSGFGSGVVPKSAGYMLQNRGALFTLEPGQPNTLAARKRPLHTIIPAFMEKGETRIGFGIMGGWNQAQAHAQFVADIVDYGMNIQQALEGGRFTKTTFEGCDVEVEELISAPTRDQLSKLGHHVETVPRRSPNFGYGQAVMDDGTGVHYGASDPRHDGAAIPQPAPVFPRR